MPARISSCLQHFTDSFEEIQIATCPLLAGSVHSLNLICLQSHRAGHSAHLIRRLSNEIVQTLGSFKHLTNHISKCKQTCSSMQVATYCSESRTSLIFSLAGFHSGNRNGPVGPIEIATVRTGLAPDDAALFRWFECLNVNARFVWPGQHCLPCHRRSK